MSYIPGTPPLRDAGKMSPLTKAARPAVKLPERLCVQARKMARAGEDYIDIAIKLGVDEDAVLQALATLRTPNTKASRATVNMTLMAWDFIRAEAFPHEARWETTDRLLSELVEGRVELLVRRAMKP